MLIYCQPTHGDYDKNKKFFNQYRKGRKTRKDAFKYFFSVPSAL